MYADFEIISSINLKLSQNKGLTNFLISFPPFYRRNYNTFQKHRQFKPDQFHRVFLPDANPSKVTFSSSMNEMEKPLLFQINSLFYPSVY
jgi:hypothetical protein